MRQQTNVTKKLASAPKKVPPHTRACVQAILFNISTEQLLQQYLQVMQCAARTQNTPPMTPATPAAITTASPPQKHASNDSRNSRGYHYRVPSNPRIVHISKLFFGTRSGTQKESATPVNAPTVNCTYLTAFKTLFPSTPQFKAMYSPLHG